MAWIWNVVGLSLLILLAAILMRKDPFDPKTLKNQRVVICGASSGIGEEIAYYYSKFGAKVFLAARRWKELERVKRKCKKLGAADAQYIAVDLGLDAGIETLVKESLSTFSGIDVLVLNHHKPFAGSWNPANWTFVKGPHEILDEQFKVNALSYMKLATGFLPELQKSSGRIGVMSTAVDLSPPGMAPYSACKAALQGFFNSLRMELFARKMNTSVTMNVLGVVASKATSEQKDMYSAKDCAMNIVEGITQRERLVAYPSYMKYLQFIHSLFPDLIEKLVIDLISMTSVS